MLSLRSKISFWPDSTKEARDGKMPSTSASKLFQKTNDKLAEQRGNSKGYGKDFRKLSRWSAHFKEPEILNKVELTNREFYFQIYTLECHFCR